jgi:predicted dehydrogenase
MEQGVERDDFIIKGELGVIRFSVFGHTITIEKENKQEVIEFAPPKHIQQHHIEKVVQYFLGKGENPCSVEEAIKSMRVMESFVYGDLK